MKPLILLIEDDINLGSSIESRLKSEGFDCEWAKNLSDADAALSGGLRPHSVILDWMLSDGQGIDWLKRVRAQSLSCPVILLTARAELVDKVLGLEVGANDYMAKPFEPRELIARLRAHLRTSVGQSVVSVSTTPEPIRIGPLEISPDTRVARFNGKTLELTKMEFDLIKLFSENPGRVFSREELLNLVWGYEKYPTTRTVDTHVLQLRQKTSETLIETVRGVGYRLKV